MKMREIRPEEVSLVDMIERGTAFHGHLGPFLVLGIRMGLVALRELGSNGYSDITVEAKVGTTPPLSCLVDGLQISTGCTLGKGNIATRPLGLAEATFTAKGRGITVKVRDGVMGEIKALSPDGIEDLAWRLAERSEEELFDLV